jgi:hypothetical protein
MWMTDRDGDDNPCCFKNVLDIFPQKVIDRILVAEAAGDMPEVKRLIMRSTVKSHALNPALLICLGLAAGLPWFVSCCCPP